MPSLGGVFGRFFGSPKAALRTAMGLAQRGQLAEAAQILTAALTAMPSAPQCHGTTAEQRFLLLAGLADVIRKDTRDAAHELAVLTECATLAVHLPPPPPGPDQVVNLVYQIHLNRGNAAGRLGQHTLAAEAYAAAFDAARDPETRCKCLAYQGWALICHQDPSKLADAWASFDRFERLGETYEAWLESVDRTLPVALRLDVCLGRVAQQLYANELSAALETCKRCLALAPTVEGVQHLLALLQRPGVTTAEARRWLVARRCGCDDAPPLAPLSPLPEGI